MPRCLISLYTSAYSMLPTPSIAGNSNLINRSNNFLLWKRPKITILNLPSDSEANFTSWYRRISSITSWTCRWLVWINISTHTSLGNASGLITTSVLKTSFSRMFWRCFQTVLSLNPAKMIEVNNRIVSKINPFSCYLLTNSVKNTKMFYRFYIWWSFFNLALFV